MDNKDNFPAVVAEEHKQAYKVWLDGRELPASLSGRLLGMAASRLDLPVVGDEVEVSLHDGGAKAVIHAVRPRSALLLRKGPRGGADAQPLAANAAKVFIVMGLDGNFNLARLERLLVAAWDSGGLPVVVLTKADLCAEDGLSAMAGAAAKAAPGVRVICVSSLSGSGVGEVEAELAGGVRCCFVGSSGAGKSTLLNRLAGREAARTGEVRADDSRGRHTTTSRQMYVLPCGGQVIDTPGVREFCVEYSGAGLDASFADIAGLAVNCRFKDCAHMDEPGCAVTAAAREGKLDPARLRSYHKLRRESERRGASGGIAGRIDAKRRQKSFGRMQRGITEQKRRLRGG